MRVAGCPKKKMAAKYDKAKSGTSHGDTSSKNNKDLRIFVNCLKKFNTPSWISESNIYAGGRFLSPPTLASSKRQAVFNQAVRGFLVRECLTLYVLRQSLAFHASVERPGNPVCTVVRRMMGAACQQYLQNTANNTRNEISFTRKPRASGLNFVDTRHCGRCFGGQPLLQPAFARPD